MVDFYNASFPSNKITNDEKAWLVKGTVDEDDGGRFFSHFYDPVYNRGLQSVFTVGVPTISSKKSKPIKMGSPPCHINIEVPPLL